jgi:hypothetical protein
MELAFLGHELKKIVSLPEKIVPQQMRSSSSYISNKINLFAGGYISSCGDKMG